MSEEATGQEEASRAFGESGLSLLDEAREIMDRWEFVGRPEGPPDWFGHAAEMPPYRAAALADPGHFDPGAAWWLAELCRLSYTPDQREASRPWRRDPPARKEYLRDPVPFREIREFHKTGNHALLCRVDSPEGGAVLCFRGTSKLRQWILNLAATLAPWTRPGEEEPEDGEVRAHLGFQILFNRVWPLVEPSLVECEGPLVFTGHSLGGAFATLAAAASRRPPAALVTFGAPRVGNLAFAGRLAGIPFHRVVNHHDIVTLLPERDLEPGSSRYSHAGDLRYLGAAPGSLISLAAPEAEEDPPWLPPDPLAHLARSLDATQPPGCIVDHTPMSYSEKLRRLAAGGSGGADEGKGKG